MPSCRQETPLAEVADQLLHESIHHLVVEDDGKVIGVVSRRDLIKVSQDLLEEPFALPLNAHNSSQTIL